MIKRVNSESDNRVDLQCLTTDLKATWPTNYDRGSTMTVCDETAETVVSYHYFNGTKWCDL